MDCSRPRAMPEGGASFLCRHGGSQTWHSSHGHPSKSARPTEQRMCQAAAAPLRTVARRSDAFAFVASDGKGKGRFAGQSMRWRPHSRQQAEALRVCSRRHFARPFNATRSGSASATEEGFARAAEYPGSRESKFGARRRDRLQDQYVSVWHKSCSHLCRQGLSLFEVENVLSAGRLNHDQCL